MNLTDFLKKLPIIKKQLLKEREKREKQKDEYYKKFSAELDKHPIGHI